MAIVKYPPRTAHLGGPKVEVNDVAAGGAGILPGMLIERYNSSGVPLWKLHSVAGGDCKTFALNQSMINKGMDDAYAVGDLVEAAIGAGGTTFWGRIATGQNITNGQKLESAGNGTLRALAAGIAVALALESMDATGGAKMLRAEFL